jgi:electron transport complex protein RnfE
MKTWLAFWYGIFKNNPIFRLVLGMCPTLAVTTSLENALGMGLAATFVLVCSNGLVSALRKVIPAAVHIPCYIVIIATFVTAIDLLMQAYLPDLSASLGIFIPLIVVNCIILGRAEAFASKNGVVDSLADGLGSGIGFTLSLALIASVREIVGAGTLTVWGDVAVKGINPGPVTLAVLPAGGFIALGLLLALINRIGEWNARRHGAPPPLPVNLDCRHCTMCGSGKGGA